MQCRPGCGACCIAPSISSPLPGLPDGKAAGVRCAHLDDDYRCRLFGDPSRPLVCERFQACNDVCGSSRDEALLKLVDLEALTAGAP